MDVPVTFLAAISNTAEIFNSLFDIFVALGLAVGAVVLGVIGYLVIKNRDRGLSVAESDDAPTLGRFPPERGKLKDVLPSLVISSVILGVLVFGTFGALDTIQNPPEDSMEVNVVGIQWAWKFTYEDGRESLGELRVPAGEAVRLQVTSQDVFHNFGIPDFKIKIDAIPGRSNVIWFVAHEPGEYDIACFELCGTGHAFMKAKLIVMESTAFQTWQAG